MYGGTSKAVFFRDEDVPQDVKERGKVILSAFCSPDCRQIDGIGAVFLGIRMGSWAYHKINIDLIKTVVCFFIGISGLITLIQHLWNLHNGAPSLAGVFHRSRSLTKDGFSVAHPFFFLP
jgi:hypothetical protein